MYRAAAIILLMLCASVPAVAWSNGRQPCDRGAGGVSHCEGRFFVCNNGQVSRSKKVCGSASIQDASSDSNKGKKKR